MKPHRYGLPILLLVLTTLACNAPGLTASPSPAAQATPTGAAAEPTGIAPIEPTQPVVTAGPTPTLVVAVVDTATPPQLTETPAPDTGIETPTPIVGTLGVPPAHGALIYQTTFQTGWANLTSGGGLGKSTVVAEGYRIEVAPNWGHYGYTTRTPVSTFYAEVVVTPELCPPGKGEYGMIFDYVDNAHYSYFVVSCSGSYLLYTVSDTGGTVLASGTLPLTITPASGSHIIGLSVSATTISMFVDNQQIGSAAAAEMPAGDIGPYVKTDTEAVTAVFSRLSVYEPGP
jgi:hypothetical protein